MAGAVEQLQAYGGRAEAVETMERRFDDSVVAQMAENVDQGGKGDGVVQVLAEVPEQELASFRAGDLVWS